MSKQKESSNMSEVPDLRISVVSQKGPCRLGHKVGDEWVMGDKTPEGICITAFNVFCPNSVALRYGSSFLWETEPGAWRVCCPNPDSALHFEIKRVPK